MYPNQERNKLELSMEYLGLGCMAENAIINIKLLQNKKDLNEKTKKTFEQAIDYLNRTEIHLEELDGLTCYPARINKAEQDFAIKYFGCKGYKEDKISKLRRSLVKITHNYPIFESEELDYLKNFFDSMFTKSIYWENDKEIPNIFF